jgi:hypothetical protein
MDFYSNISNTIDLREEMHAVLHGRADITAQGRQVILRRISDNTCPACWNETTAGSSRPNCPYCKGEGYQFHETSEIMAIFRGVTPVYKPGVLATGEYPQSSMGYTDENRGTGYVEVFREDGSQVYPDYERYTFQTHKSYDKLYELKVDPDGDLARDSKTGRYIRCLKWKVLSVIPIYGDNGRVEFFELAMEKENV